MLGLRTACQLGALALRLTEQLLVRIVAAGRVAVANSFAAAVNIVGSRLVQCMVSRSKHLEPDDSEIPLSLFLSKLLRHVANASTPRVKKEILKF